MHSKTVTVFGGTGFIGRHLVDALADRGWRVKVVTRRPASGNYLRTAGVVGQVVPVSCNLYDINSVRSVIQGSDYVVNLIGILYETGRQKFSKIHADFPGILGKACKEEKIERIIHVSALGASHSAPSAYLTSKAQGEKKLLHAFPKATILRPSIIFGEGEKFFRLFALMSKVSAFIPLIGGGQTRFQPVYVGDVVTTMMTALTATGKTLKSLQGKVIECVGLEVKIFKELIKDMLEAIGLKRFLIPIPWWLAKCKGAFLQLLPIKILTLDQVKTLFVDNVATGQHMTMQDIGITPTSLSSKLPEMMEIYREGGEFSDQYTAQ